MQAESMLQVLRRVMEKAYCQSCGLMLKVEPGQALPPCDECGGHLLLEEQEQESPVKACPSCEADNPEKARFCESCGADMSAKGKSRQRGDKVASRQANVELGKARRIIKRVRSLFIIQSVGWALLTLGLFMVLDQEDLLGESSWMLMVPFSICLFCILGSIFLAREPFIWSMAIASLQTLVVALYPLEFGFSIDWLIITFITIASWAATASLTKVKKLLAEHSDTIGAQKLMGTREKAYQGDLGRKHRQRLKEESRGKLKRRAIFISAILVVVVGIGIWAAKANRKPTWQELQAAEQQREAERLAKMPKPEEFTPVLQKFVQDWNQSDKEAIHALFLAWDKEKWIRGLKRVGERNGWEGVFPTLSDEDIQWRGKREVYVYYQLAERRFLTRWECPVDESRWYLRSFTLRKAD